MKRTIAAILIALSFFCCTGTRASAASPAGERVSLLTPRKLLEHLDAGVEWGYSATFCNTYHYNYISEDSGSRVDVRDKDMTYKSNGHLYCYVGAKFCKELVADLTAGWAGVYEERRVIPLTMRLSWFPKGYAEDGFKYFVEGGTFLADLKGRDGTYLLKAGVGHRYMLGEFLALDLALSAQQVADHPLDIFDKQAQVSVPDANLRRSDCRYTCINLSLSLSF